MWNVETYFQQHVNHIMQLFQYSCQEWTEYSKILPLMWPKFQDIYEFKTWMASIQIIKILAKHNIYCDCLICTTECTYVLNSIKHQIIMKTKVVQNFLLIVENKFVLSIYFLQTAFIFFIVVLLYFSHQRKGHRKSMQSCSQWSPLSLDKAFLSWCYPEERPLRFHCSCPYGWMVWGVWKWCESYALAFTVTSQCK